MDNPYTPPTGADVSKMPKFSKGTRILRAVVATASGLLGLIFLVVAVVLLLQAWRFNSEAQRIPLRAQPGHSAIVRGSAITGLTAIVSTILNLIGIVLRRDHVKLPSALLIISVAAMAIVSVVFKPV